MFSNEIQNFLENIEAFQIIILLLGLMITYVYGYLKPLHQIIFKFIFGAVVIYFGGMEIVHLKVGNQAIPVIRQNQDTITLFINGAAGGLIFCVLLFLFSLLEQMVLGMLVSTAAAFLSASLLIRMGIGAGTWEDPNYLLYIIALGSGITCAVLALRMYRSTQRKIIQSSISGAFLIIGTMGERQIVPDMINQFSFMLALIREHGFDLDVIGTGILENWAPMVVWPHYIQERMGHFLIFAGSGMLIQFAVHSYRKNKKAKHKKTADKEANVEVETAS